MGATAAAIINNQRGHKAAVTTTAGTSPATSADLGGGDPVAGKAIFKSSGCSACHILAAAGATGKVGPNLDTYLPTLYLILDRVRSGAGLMPSFKSRLNAKQIKDVAAFVYWNELNLDNQG